MVKLKKELGLFEITVYGVGVILGAGIYAIMGEGAGLAGNAVWMSFIIAAIVASFTGLSYAELSSMYPKTAAEYNYTRKAFRKEWLAFLVGFTMIVAGLFFSATVSIGFAGYFSALFGTPIIMTAIGLIVVLSLINFMGIKQSSKVNIISTFIELSGLVIIIIIGLPYIGGAVNYFAAPFGMSGIVGAAALLFFAFIGFENIANISEEAKNATKIIPRALILSLIISTILYILVAISAVSVIGWEGLSMSSAPLADVAVAGMGASMHLVLSVIALFATGNTVLIMLIVTSRMMYGISREYSRGLLSKIHKRTGTPHLAIIAVLILSSFATLLGDLGTVANMTNAGVFITYLFVNSSLIRMRYTKPKEERPFKVPINIGKMPVLPVLGIITSLFMLIQFDAFILTLELILIGLGYLFFRMFVKK
ncbi:MAG: amino acid permease [Deltaproteobacteria bacterium]|nr:amino acid permease [Deltaproteobacteria bacterium]